ncbi:hypothetical protein SLS60_006498 [Paraconiothyrium brasiliense]|uniref:Uncharacterized protein n=1 Tax=Paraconiothyrium brasiliense TaxID=300254 RepID=A0ABR3RAY0_9PLEO
MSGKKSPLCLPWAVAGKLMEGTDTMTAFGGMGVLLLGFIVEKEMRRLEKEGKDGDGKKGKWAKVQQAKEGHKAEDNQTG